MSHLEAANSQIRAAQAQQGRLREAHRRAHVPIEAIDAIIAALEEMHLAGRKRVPQDFDERLSTLNTILPPDLRRELRSRITIAHLMDELYAIQETLLTRVPGRRRFEGEDEHVTDDAGGWQKAS